MNNEANVLLEIIDKRIRKILKEEHICYRYIAKIQGASGVTYATNTSVPVILMGFDPNSDKYYFTNRTGVQLHAGDLVYIDAIGNNLNSGVITQIYKYKTELFIE